MNFNGGRYITEVLLTKMMNGSLAKGKDLTFKRDVLLYTYQEVDESAHDEALRWLSKASRISGDHFMRIVDTGSEEGRLNVILQLETGCPLSERLNDLEITGQKVLAYVYELAEGIRDARRNRLPECAVDADNLWLDDKGRLRILNFWTEGRHGRRGVPGLALLLYQLGARTDIPTSSLSAYAFEMNRLFKDLPDADRERAVVMASSAYEGVSTLAEFQAELEALLGIGGEKKAGSVLSEERERRESGVMPQVKGRTKGRSKEYVKERAEEQSKEQPEEYAKGHVKEDSKGQPEEYVKEHSKVRPKGHLKEHVKGDSEGQLKVQSKEYTKKRLKEQSKEHLKEDSKERPKAYAKEHSVSEPKRPRQSNVAARSNVGSGSQSEPVKRIGQLAKLRRWPLLAAAGCGALVLVLWLALRPYSDAPDGLSAQPTVAASLSGERAGTAKPAASASAQPSPTAGSSAAATAVPTTVPTAVPTDAAGGAGVQQPAGRADQVQAGIVPNLIEQTGEDAEEMARAAGLRYEYFLESNAAAKGVVFKQDLTPGAAFNKGDRITFWVSKGQ